VPLKMIGRKLEVIIRAAV